MMRENYKDIIDRLGLLVRLAEFEPVVIGTPPLGIDIEDSDIDVACFASDLDRFCRVTETQFHAFSEFSIRKVQHLSEPAVVASFQEAGWEIELFCQNMKTRTQSGVRHFYIEQRLLALEPRLGMMVSRLKRNGFKTEAAFAKVLKLSGDPYTVLFDLEDMTDTRVRQIVAQALDET